MENEELQQSLVDGRSWFIKCCRLPEGSNVFPRRTLLLLTWTAVMNSFGYYPLLLFMKLTYRIAPTTFMVMSILQSCIFIMYPIADVLAEVHWSRYKLMVFGTVVSVVGVLIGGPAIAALIQSCFGNFFIDKGCHFKHSFVLIASFGLILYYVGLCLFQSNAIQFGIDQLQSTSDEKVSLFTSWYLWVTYTSQYTCLPIIYLFITNGSSYIAGSFLLIPICLLFICCREYRKHLISEPGGRTNPVKLIWSRTRCCRRSKNHGDVSPHNQTKNRGFKDVEEDVTIFYRILFILLSMFGYFLVQSVSLPASVLYDFDDDWLIGTQHKFLFLVEFVYSVPILLIPLYMMILRKYPSTHISKIYILKKMGAGLLVAVISLTVTTILSAEFNAAYTLGRSLQIHISIFVLISSLLRGVSLVLVFLSALQFILLEAPHTMQGLLIALWYSFQAIPTLLQLTSSYRYFTRYYSFWYYSVKTLLSLISLSLFILVYHRRKRYLRANYINSIINGYHK